MEARAITDAQQAGGGGLLEDQFLHGFIEHVGRQDEEGIAHDLDGPAFQALFLGGAQGRVPGEPIDHHPAGQGFHQAVQAEAHQGDGPGQDAGHQGQDAFHHVVGDGEVGQVQGLALQVGHVS